MADEAANSQPTNPKPISSSSSALESAEWGFGGIALGLIFFGIIFLVLNYFNIIILSKAMPFLSFLPHRPITQQSPTTNQPLTQPNNNQNIEEKLSINCPVPKEYCNKGVVTKYKSDPALAFQIASNSAVLNSTQIENAKDVEIFQNDLDKSRTIFVSKTVNNTCYVITYIVAKDALIDNLSSFPVPISKNLATVTQTTLPIETGQANVIIQIRKMPIAPDKPCNIDDNPYKDAYPPIPISSVQIL